MKWLKNEKGMALASVLLVLTVGSILVVSMMAVSASENRQAIYQTNSMKAYYIARAGADSMVRRLLTMDKDYWHDFDTEQETNSTAFGGGSVTVSVHRTGDDFAVVATGTYRGVTRDVTAMLKYNPNTKMDYLIYSKESMVGLNPKVVNGIIGSGGSIAFKNPNYVDLHDVTLDEYVVFNPEFTDYSFTEAKLLLPGDTTVNPTTTTQSTLFTNSVNSGNWTVDTGSAEFSKQVDFDVVTMVQETSSDQYMILWFSKDSVISGDLTVTGANNLIIVVEDKLTISGSIFLNGTGNVEIHVIDNDDAADDLVIAGPNDTVGDSTDIGRVVTYLTEGSQMDLSINGSYYGCVIGPDATVSMKNGKTQFYGTLYTNAIIIDAQVSLSYDLPSDPTTVRLESIQFAYWQ